MKTKLFSILILATAFRMQAQTYCEPTYFVGPDQYDHITGVSFKSLLFGTTFSLYTRTYTEGVWFTDKTFSATAADWGGTTIGKYHASTLDVDVYSVDDYTLYVGAWVDWNNDMDFDDINETLGIETVFPFSGIGSAQFLIDELNNTAGVHRVRIRTSDNIDIMEMTPCGELFFGEAIDFLISIVEKPYCNNNYEFMPNNWAGLPINSFSIQGVEVPVQIQNAGITYIEAAPAGTPALATVERGSYMELAVDLPDDFEGFSSFYLAYLDHDHSNTFENGYEEIGAFFSDEANTTMELFIPETYAIGTHNLRIRIVLGGELDICYNDFLNTGIVIDERITIVDPETGTTENMAATGLSVSPNPTMDNLYITVDEPGIFQASVFALSGQEIWQGRGTGTLALDVDLWEDGVYILKVHKENGSVISTKFVKQ